MNSTVEQGRKNIPEVDLSAELNRILIIVFTVLVLLFHLIQQAEAGNINYLNGNNFQQETDISFNSPFDNGFKFKRCYNSQSADTTTMGHGWRHNYDIILHPQFNDSQYLIKIKGRSGRGYYFEDYDLDGLFKGAFQEISSIIRNAQGSYIWTRSDGMVYTFDSTGLLTSIADKNGNIQSFVYNDDNLLETVTDNATGRVLTLFYSHDNKIQYITGPVISAVPDGIWVSYIYDDNDNLTGVAYADGENGSAASGFEYRYEDPYDPNNLTMKLDAQGTILSSWTYDENNRAVSNTNNRGTGIIVDYTDPDEIEVTDVYGVATVYSISEIAGRRKIIQSTAPAGCFSCSGGIYQTEFDPDTGYPTRREYFNGRVDTFQDYDDNFNPQTIVTALGTPEQRVFSKTWHPDLSAPLTITETSLLADASNPDRVITTVYDYDDPDASGNTDTPNENPTQHIHRLIEKGFTLDASGSVAPFEYITEYTYTETGQVETVDGPITGSGDMVSFGYNPVTSDLESVTYPVTGTVTFNHDDAGNIISMVDVNNIETGFTYDGRNRLLTTSINSKTAAQEYGASGELSGTTDRAGREITYTYNAAGLLEKIINSKGDYLFFGYDANADMVEESIYSSTGIKTLFKGYDFGDPASNTELAPGRLYQSIQRNQEDTADLVTTYRYAHGNVAAVTPPDNLQTGYEYDSMNRISAKIRENGAVDIREEYEYDTHGNLCLVRDDNGLETIYTYDDMDNLVTIISPDTGTTRYTYDASSNPSSENKNGRIANYLYDSQGRLTDVQYPDDALQNVHLDYDQGLYGTGRLTGVTDPSGTSTYSYNIYGYLVSETKNILGISYTTTYDYDDDGILSSITYPSGRKVRYQLDKTGNTREIKTEKTGSQVLAYNIQWYPFGPLKSFSYPSGIAYESTLDLNYLPKRMTGSSIMDMSYLRNDMGFIDTTVDNLDSSQNQSFGYDNQYHLTDGSNITGDFHFSYDTVGNRLSTTKYGVTQTYSYLSGKNQIYTVSNGSILNFAYNDDGSITDINSRRFSYNFDNRLIQVSDGQAVLGQYTYNYYGQRVSKTVNGTTTIFHYDSSGNLIAETDSLGNTIKEYVYIGQTPLALIIYGSPEYSPLDLDQDGDMDGKDLTGLTGMNVSGIAKEYGKQYDPTAKVYFYHNDHLGTPG